MSLPPKKSPIVILMFVEPSYSTFVSFLGHNVSFSRSGEKDLIERLDGIVSIPQEWHKKKVLCAPPPP